MKGELWFFVSFRIFFSDNRRVRIFIYFFPEFNIRLYDKNSESDYFFSLHQNQNIFFSNIGNQIIFLAKNHNPPLQVKWSYPYEFLANKYEKLEDTKEVFRKNKPNEKGEKRGQKMKQNIDQYNRDKPMRSRGVSSS